MSVAELIVQKLHTLSEADQEKVLDYIESLGTTAAPSGRKDPCGMFAHYGIHISAEDIEEARREAWGNFPREAPRGSAE